MEYLGGERKTLQRVKYKQNDVRNEVFYPEVMPRLCICCRYD